MDPVSHDDDLHQHVAKALAKAIPDLEFFSSYLAGIALRARDEYITELTWRTD